jgi:hypothetical protein
MRINAAKSWWLWLSATVALHASAPSANSYAIDLQGYVLHFSLPEEMADAIPPWKLVQTFDPADRDYLSAGFLQVAAGLYELKGPFWVGTRGSLGLNVTVQRRSRDYTGAIDTLDGLERYLRWWMRSGNHVEVFSFENSMLGGKCVRRWCDTFDAPPVRSGEREELEIYSVPLGGDEFLDIGFDITESIPGTAEKWKKKAEELRDAIKATVVLEPKPAGHKG